MRTFSPALGYILAVVFVILATLVREAVDPLLHNSMQFVTFFVAIALAGAVGGRGPALAASALSYLSVDYLFTEPRYTLALHNTSDQIGLLIFVFGAGAISWIAGRLHHALHTVSARAEILGQQAALIDLSPDGIIMRKLDGTITFWSRGAEALYGWTRQEAIGQNIHGLLQTQFPQPVEDILGEIRRAGRWSGELIHRTRSGENIIVQSWWLGKFDDQGEIIGLMESNMDITGRKRTEAALRQSEERFRRLSETSTFGLAIIDYNGGVHYANPLLLTLFGYRAEEVQAGQVRWNRMVPLEHAARALRAVEEVKANGMCVPFEIEAMAKDGHRIPVLVGASVLERKEGGNDIIALFITDLTAIRKIQNALVESEERFRVTQELSPDGFTILRPVRDSRGQIEDFTFVYQNAAIGRMTGIEPAATVGRRLREVFPNHGDTPFDEAYRQVARTGELRILEAQYQNEALPRPKWFRVAVVPIGSDIAILAQDITDRKEAEGRLQRFNEELENRISERTEELKSAVDELRRSNADLEQFAYISSHDLQEPLRMVSNYVGLLQHRYRDRLDEEAESFIGFAVEGAVRMSNLIKDLLAYSRVTSQGKEPQAVDANAVLKQTLASLQLRIEETCATVTHDPLPTVRADPTQLGQVFQNLISNAIKYRRDTEPPKIHLSADQRDGYWLFTVQDNGIGIQPEHFEYIFMPFKRLHADRAKYPGSGVGLAIVKRIVERHHGQVCLDSRPGEGSTFYFTIPVSPEEDDDPKRTMDRGPSDN